MDDKEFEHNLTIIGYVFGSCFTVLGTIAIYIKCRLRQKVANSSEPGPSTDIELTVSGSTDTDNVAVTLQPEPLKIQGISSDQVQDWS